MSLGYLTARKNRTYTGQPHAKDATAWWWGTNSNNEWSVFKSNNCTWNTHTARPGTERLLLRKALWRVYGDWLHIWRVLGILPEFNSKPMRQVYNEQVESRARLWGQNPWRVQSNRGQTATIQSSSDQWQQMALTKASKGHRDPLVCSGYHNQAHRWRRLNNRNLFSEFRQLKVWRSRCLGPNGKREAAGDADAISAKWLCCETAFQKISGRGSNTTL